MKKAIIALLVVVVLIGFYAFNIYNKMVTANEGVDGQWAQVETQYQRRFDLIPNLVSSVKGAMSQEEKVFGDIAEARTRYSGAASPEEKVQAANEVESAIGRLLVIMENYPELKSLDTVQSLMVQLEGTENRVAVERKRYNDEVQSFNTMVKRIPAKFFASMFGFEERTYFASVEGSENAPTVSFE
ncbi:MAG: LemA family protein [Candidatus Magasanikbacteria bacterium CG_4_9_14_3_um_filter_32_9]|uniref:LemA family protein n=1 Tax=Candidatus Magasanikbacteria bacterium CG_4_9_14_3_um_filter_32_9 TaxID=1974644 RepID=A0A2M7Z7G6_9BACT|nr:MAG: LemA family protein [Candidatus Magasanikbacteria bacterium CG_4_9_14_3_um_filter_32_9]